MIDGNADCHRADTHRHGRMACIAFFDFLLDEDGFLNRGKVTHDGGREHRRRGRTFELRRGLFEEADHVGEEIPPGCRPSESHHRCAETHRTR
jgi:hypothetical protein